MLQLPVEQLLFNMSFIERYKAISAKFSQKDSTYNCEPLQVIEILEGLGIRTKLSNGDQFFADFELIGDFKFRFGLTIKYNIIEFDISIINPTLNIRSGGSFGLIVQLMTDWSTSIINPGFSNFEQLKSLLEEGVKLFDDVKTAVLKLQSPQLP